MQSEKAHVLDVKNFGKLLGARSYGLSLLQIISPIAE